MYLIDTNVVSETRKGAKANPGVVDFFRHAADAQQPLLAPRAVLPWRESEGGRHLPAVGELLPIAHRRDQGGCDDRPDAAKLLQALCHRIALRDQRDFPVQFPNTSIQCQEIAPESVQ